MTVRYLVSLTVQAFDGIPAKVVPRTVRLADPALEGPRAIKWILSGYCDKLLCQNAGLQEVMVRFAGRFDDPECQNRLTRGQRILHALGALDGQVNNGGIAQFFWNCPDLIFAASDALRALETTEPRELYEKALESLVGKQEDWNELRKQCCEGPGNPRWETFQASYNLLDMGWFDEAYFDRCGALLRKQLVDYVKTHREEFITS